MIRDRGRRKRGEREPRDDAGSEESIELSDHDGDRNMTYQSTQASAILSS